jgi:hypothetical protein
VLGQHSTKTVSELAAHRTGRPAELLNAGLAALAHERQLFDVDRQTERAGSVAPLGQGLLCFGCNSFCFAPRALGGVVSIPRCPDHLSAISLGVSEGLTRRKGPSDCGSCFRLAAQFLGLLLKRIRF